MAVGTASKTRAKTGARSGTGASPRINPGMRFRWLQLNHATVIYQGDECLINVGARKTPFRGDNLTRAVNAGMEAIPLADSRA